MKTRIQSILIVIIFLSAGLLTQAKAVSPPPDGCYPALTTAEGCNALKFLTNGAGNTGVGWYSLYGNSTGNFNTGLGGGALALNNADGNTAVGAGALLLNTSGAQNVAIGTDALLYNDSGAANTANGAFALFRNTTGAGNVTMGWDALLNNDNGSENVAIGEESLLYNVSGGFNTVVGAMAGADIQAGNNNTVVGAMAGANIQRGNNNVYIGYGVDAGGPFDESDTIRIGRAPNATSPALHCFIGGIAPGGATANVQVNPDTGELLQVVSSARYKENIKPMDKASEAIFALKPVTFRYKKKLDVKGIPQFGLVAEEVAKVNPDLVVLDREGRPDSVRYEGVNAMLLNEFLKEHRAFTQEQRKVAQQQKEIESLKAELKEQRALIQKVSDRAELNRSTSRVIVRSQ